LKPPPPRAPSNPTRSRPPPSRPPPSTARSNPVQTSTLHRPVQPGPDLHRPDLHPPPPGPTRSRPPPSTARSNPVQTSSVQTSALHRPVQPGPDLHPPPPGPTWSRPPPSTARSNPVQTSALHRPVQPGPDLRPPPPGPTRSRPPPSTARSNPVQTSALHRPTRSRPPPSTARSNPVQTSSVQTSTLHRPVQPGPDLLRPDLHPPPPGPTRFNMHPARCILAAAATLAAWTLCAAGPFHAQCRVQWYFGVPCRTVRSALVTQITKWRSTSSCARGGETCLYKLQSDSAHFITAKHASPVTGHVDDLTFRLVSSDLFTRCRVAAMSVSESWYVVLDHGTNYCNLYNLIQGSGLTEAQGYQEVTSDFLCTQRSSANCTVY
uniref:Uncharacterized protein n=2 Tax=Denticeps clupeoides TaxID=299321 RepID=A0AAY4A0H6_9TELE